MYPYLIYIFDSNDGKYYESASLKLGVSSADTTADFLENKLENYSGIVLEKVNAAGNEKLKARLIDSYLTQASTGLHTGAELTVGGTAGTFSISSGKGFWIDANTDFALIKDNLQEVIIEEDLDIAITNLGTHNTTYVMVSKTGVTIQITTYPTPNQRRDNIFLGAVFHADNTNVDKVTNLPNVAVDNTAQVGDIMQALGVFNLQGNVVKPNGANLSLNKTSGEVFSQGVNFHTDNTKPNSVETPEDLGFTFRYINLDGTVGSDVTVLDPTTWDDGGTTTAIVGTAKTTVVRVFLLPDNSIRVQRGQKIYDNRTDALIEINNGDFVTAPVLQNNAVLLCSIVLRSGATDLTQTSDALFLKASKLGELNGVDSNVSEPVRTDFQRITSGQELDDFFPNVSGVITLTKNVEIEGTITTPHQVDINGFYYIGKQAFTDIHNYSGTSDAFIGGNGGTVKLLTLVAAGVGAKLFNLDDTANNKNFVLREVILANNTDIGKLKGFYLVALDIINCQNNTEGIEYEDIEHLYAQNIFWSSTNTGTLETYTGDFEVIQNIGGQYDVSSGVTGVDVTGITSIDSGEILSSPFLGDGTYTVGTFEVEWLVNCGGIKLQGDQFSKAYLSYANGTTNTNLTVNVWEYFEMPTATLDSQTSHRFGQLTLFPDTLVYLGKHTISKGIVMTTGLRKLGGGTNTYQMRIVKNGLAVGAEKQFELGNTDGSITLTSVIEFETDDQIWLEIRNITDNDDVRLLSCNISVI